jgi:hypothetical protein
MSVLPKLFPRPLSRRAATIKMRLQRNDKDLLRERIHCFYFALGTLYISDRFNRNLASKSCPDCWCEEEWVLKNSFLTLIGVSDRRRIKNMQGAVRSKKDNLGTFSTATGFINSNPDCARARRKISTAELRLQFVAETKLGRRVPWNPSGYGNGMR